MSETERIKKAYKKRDHDDKREVYSLFSPANLYIAHKRELAVIKSLKKAGIKNLSEMKILDIGCGRGGSIREFIKFGATPGNCYGIDLIPERIEIAQILNPNVNYTCGNAEGLPFDDGFFDIVLCYTVFSSVLNKSMRNNISGELMRVLRSNGSIIWYDFFYNNPSNPDVIGIRRREIQDLFPGCRYFLDKCILIPAIARRVALVSYTLCHILDTFPLLRSFYIGAIVKD